MLPVVCSCNGDMCALMAAARAHEIAIMSHETKASTSCIIPALSGSLH